MKILLTNAPYLASVFGSAGCEVHLLSSPSRDRMVSETVKLVSADRLGIFARAQYMAAYIRENQIDVVFAQGVWDLAFFGVVRRLTTSRYKIIVTSHNSYMWRSKWKPIAFALSARLLSDGLVILCAGACGRIGSLSRVMRLRCWQVANPVELSHYAAARSIPQPGPLRVGYIAVLRPLKGQEVLVRAAGILKRAGCPVEIHLVGDFVDCEYKSRINRIVAEESLDGCVFLHGRVDHEAVPALLASWDIYACPSFSEMMPINVLEAMAAGLPVVGSRIWGVEDAVEHGVNGYLVEPGSASEFADRLAQFGHDVELGKAFGSKAMEIVRSRFSAAAVWQQYEAAFQELGVISRRCGIH